MNQRLSAWVACRCKEASFQRFLHAPDEAAAVACVRAICGVKSRAEIERDPEAMDRFNEFIRLPYQQFLEAANDSNHQEK